MTIRLLAFLIGGSTMAHGQTPSFMELHGRQFMVDGVPVFMKMINYDAKLVSSVDGSSSAAHLHVAPGSGYDVYNNNQYECNSNPTCDDQFVKHLNKIGTDDPDSPMGYNAIRLWGISPTICEANNGTLTIAYPIHYCSPTGFNLSTYWIHLQGPDFQDEASLSFFGAIRHFLEVCEGPDIRVMLLGIITGADGLPPGYHQVSIVHNQAVIDLYRNYLHRLAEELEDEPMLFAYDLFNEPGAGNQASGIPSENVHKQKSIICDATSEWYDAIHSADNNHYVTIGATCKVSDLNSWDPSAMKLDFYSPHVYPDHKSSTASAVNAAKKSTKAEMYWLGANSPMPVVIGETGFTADDDTQAPEDIYQPDPGGVLQLDGIQAHHEMPYMHGSEAQQSSYATSLFTYAPYCLISGLAWWGFQNDTWANLASSTNSYNGMFWGPLHYGNPASVVDPPWNGIEHSWRDKAMVQAVRNVNISPLPSTITTPPDNYLSWNDYQGMEIWSLQFEDQYGRPIREMVCDVTYCYHNLDGRNETMHAHFVPDANGYLSIRQNPTNGPTNEPGWYVPWIELDCKILGGPTLLYSGEDIPNPDRVELPPLGTLVHVTRDYFAFDHIESGVLVEIDAFRDLRGWQSLAVSDLIVEGNGSTGGEVWAHARSNVHLSGETHIAQAAEAHIWTGPTFADCSFETFGATFGRAPSDTHTKNGTARQLSELQLRFLAGSDGCALSSLASPVLSDHLVLDQIYGRINYTVTSTLGTLITSGTLEGGLSLDVNNWTAGQYILTLSCPEGVVHQNLIKL
jgi:hypothetical protein